MSTRTTRAGTKRPAPQSSSAEASNKSDTPKKRTKVAETSKATSITDSDEKNDSGMSSHKLKIQEEIGDIFDAPANTLIIHACNCLGHWGAGIAKAFKDSYPRAHEIHKEYCKDHSFALLDTAQLIPPVNANGNKAAREDSLNRRDTKNDQSESQKHFIGCLFTSRRYGRQKDTPKRILAATKPSMEDLLTQVDEWNSKAGENEDKIKEVRMCKINSGLFAVPWEKSKKELESIYVGDRDVKMIKIVSRAEG